MRNVKKNIKKAFTLIEILIVVVILGILAAIVVPQFTSATQDSQAGNIKAQLGTLQRQIELYYAKNNAYPTWSTLATGPDYGWTPLIAGNYIKSAPVNPAVPASATAVAKSGISTINDTFGANTQGWVWNGSGAALAQNQNRLFASYFDEAAGNVTPSTP
ncbi:MAG: prepilin-type N-terminal cleavage/methylation domain-containing protein [Phycisphaerales bacterium]